MIFFKKIKTAVKNKVWKKLFENFLSLSVLQGISFITELITFPYLTQTLGAGYYGLISFALSFILSASAQSESGLNVPHNFFGKVFVNGIPAPDGILIVLVIL